MPCKWSDNLPLNLKEHDISIILCENLNNGDTAILRKAALLITGSPDNALHGLEKL